MNRDVCHASMEHFVLGEGVRRRGSGREEGGAQVPYQSIAGLECRVHSPGGSQVRWRIVTQCCLTSRDYPATHLQRERQEGDGGGGGGGEQ